MPTPPEGSTSPMTFPVPEAELNAFTVNDSYGVAWNSSVEFDVRLNDPAANTAVDQSDVFAVPGIAGMTPMYGALTYSRAGVSGSLSYDSVTGKFTYTPNGALIESDYTVTFLYYLTQTTGSGDSTLVMMSEPALVTITVYSPTYLIVSKTNTGGNPDHLFTFTVTIGGVLYNGTATVTTEGEPGSDPVTITDGILTLKGGQSARIDGIAVGASYVVTETARDGYTPAPVSGEVSGTLTADGATASFTNDYAASGSVTLSGTKFLDGRKLTAGEFTFELYKVLTLKHI